MGESIGLMKKKILVLSFESGAGVFPEESQLGKYSSRCDHQWSYYKCFVVTQESQKIVAVNRFWEWAALKALLCCLTGGFEIIP